MFHFLELGMNNEYGLKNHHLNPGTSNSVSTVTKIMWFTTMKSVTSLLNTYNVACTTWKQYTFKYNWSSLGQIFFPKTLTSQSKNKVQLSEPWYGTYDTGPFIILTIQNFCNKHFHNHISLPNINRVITSRTMWWVAYITETNQSFGVPTVKSPLQKLGWK
jgi:hypothetical protein